MPPHSRGPFLCALLVLGTPLVTQTPGGWDLANPAQPGQLTLWLSTPGGGSCGLPVEPADFNGDGSIDFGIGPLLAPSGPLHNRTDGGEVVVFRGNGTIGGTVDLQNPPAGQPLLRVYGASAFDYLGTDLASGDVTGDGVADLLIGAMGVDPGGRNVAGAAYLFPGGASFGGTVDLSSVPASVIRILGRDAGDRLGIWTAIGDLNGDGVKEIVLGADGGDGAGNAHGNRGEVVVVWGGQAFPAVIDLSAPPAGIQMTVIHGLENGDHLGTTLHTADLDGDGIEDLLVAAAMNRAMAANTGPAVVGGDGPGNARPECGDDYVLWGRPTWPAVIDLAAPDVFTAANLTVIYGADGGDTLGEEVKAGDFDGDGAADIALGALTSSGPNNGAGWTGEAAVIYGGPQLRGAVLDMRTFPAGTCTVYGAGGFEIAADSLAGTDVNADGFDDLAVGSPYRTPVKPSGSVSLAGAVDVVFGGPVRWPSSMILGQLGFDVPSRTLWGADTGDVASYSMEARDCDGDGFGDVFPNGMRGDGSANSVTDAGEAYVISGRALSRGVVTLAARPRIGTSFGINLRAEPSAPFVAALSLGTSPPIALPGGGSIALALDPVFLLSLDPSAPFFTSMTGTLDVSGRGQCGLIVPGVPSLAGAHLHAAFITLAGAWPNIATISTTTGFVLQP